MTTFEDKEKAAENKYARDQETEFRISARRNKLLGMWAAGKMGLEGKPAEDYARNVITADFEKPGDSEVFAKLKADLAAKGVPVTDAEIKAEMQQLMLAAREQITGQ